MNGQQSDCGTLTAPGGSTDEGQWELGKLHGIAIHRCSKDAQTKREWSQGQFLRRLSLEEGSSFSAGCALVPTKDVVFVPQSLGSSVPCAAPVMAVGGLGSVVPARACGAGVDVQHLVPFGACAPAGNHEVVTSETDATLILTKGAITDIFAKPLQPGSTPLLEVRGLRRLF